MIIFLGVVGFSLQSSAMDDVQRLNQLLQSRDPSRALVAAGVGAFLTAATTFIVKAINRKKWGREAAINAGVLVPGADNTALQPRRLLTPVPEELGATEAVPAHEVRQRCSDSEVRAFRGGWVAPVRRPQ